MSKSGEERSGISDEDIIECYLRPKVNKEATAIPRFIVDMEGEELYTREPWLLPQVPTDPMVNPREWFYFARQHRSYLPAKGVYFEGYWSRQTDGGLVLSTETGELIGGWTLFRYYFRNRDDEDDSMYQSNWFMREYRLYDNTNPLRRYRQVLCKITTCE